MDKGVVEKCLALCQALTTDNKSFSFSLTMGSDIVNFSSKKLVKSSCGKKKKKSSSQLGREERRRQGRKSAESWIKDLRCSSSEIFPLCSFSTSESVATFWSFSPTVLLFWANHLLINFSSGSPESASASGLKRGFALDSHQGCSFGSYAKAVCTPYCHVTAVRSVQEGLR